MLRKTALSHRPVLEATVLVLSLVIAGCSTGRQIAHPAATSAELGVGDLGAVARTERRFDRDADGVFAVSTEELRSLVVLIEVVHSGGAAIGSGVILCPSGRQAAILTASHVLTGGGPADNWGIKPEEFKDVREIRVSFQSGDRVKVRPQEAIVRQDRHQDVALLRVPLPSARVRLPQPRISAESRLQPGDSLRTIGHSSVSGKMWMPEYLTVNESGEFIVFRPALDTGYSGGPVFDSKGLLVGMNSHVVASLTEAVPIGRALRAVGRSSGMACDGTSLATGRNDP